MDRALFTEQVRAAERRAADAGTPLAALMDRAGAAVADAAERMAPAGPIAVVAGHGNNGGDGWVAARLLTERGRAVIVVALADPSDAPEPGRAAAAAARAAGVPTVFGVESLSAALSDAALAIDAMLGIGIRGGLREPYASAVEALSASGVPVLAVDVPTGVDADTGAVDGPAVRASVTVTFGSMKAGLLQHPGAALAGRIEVAGIGLDTDGAAGPCVELLDERAYAALVPTIAPDANKGSRGRLLVIAGSGGMSGAAVLAAAAAQRTGAGYVTLAVPASLVDIADAGVRSAVTLALPETASRSIARGAIELLTERATAADAVVLGPGLSRDPETAGVVRALVERIERPLLIDADALNVFEGAVEHLLARFAPTVITPHPGEAGRLLGVTAAEVQRDRYGAARRLSTPTLAVALKGARTVVAHGRRLAVERAGNPGLATTGTGDVLSGIVGALLAQGLAPYEAALLGVHIHALAGDRAAAAGMVGMVAEDVVAAIRPTIAGLTADGTDAGVR
jgi:NAD(P)H-hydrate epimerase